jgi:hypothetical protein
MHEWTARKRAISLLNSSMPQHPPDIYFIRRNERLREKYMDQDEMANLIKNADPRLKNNYRLFAIKPNENFANSTFESKKKSFLNPKDPYLNPLVFKRQHHRVNNTN